MTNTSVLLMFKFVCGKNDCGCFDCNQILSFQSLMAATLYLSSI